MSLAALVTVAPTATAEPAAPVAPAVAQPGIDFGWTAATVTLNPKDQRIILNGGGAAFGAMVGAVACSASGPGAVLCGAVGAAVGAMVFAAIQEYGVREGCNVKVTLNYVPPGTVRKIWRSGKGC
ncbi:hypothetical protein [Actinokineospora sp. HUAS TT18]|uniref:hypothetical protein n=1 Tax=Actinokineospora sp. HUAS TT18 TaxID=3447451 RepID=UPI003F51BCFA